MGQKLFSVGKVGLFVDAVSSGMEKRRGGNEAKVLRLVLRVTPFDAKLATAIDDGLGGDSNVRASVFKLNSAEVKPHLERWNFSLDCPRQRLDIYASPDTDSSRLCFDQVKVSGFYVRTQKDTAALSAVFTATFGPVGRDELEAAHAAFRTQMFVTFSEAEPDLAFEEADGDEDDDDAPFEARHVVGPRPITEPPMFDEDEPPAESIADREKRSRPTAKRGTKPKTRKHDPEAEHASQVAAGKATVQ